MRLCNACSRCRRTRALSMPDVRGGRCAQRARAWLSTIWWITLCTFARTHGQRRFHWIDCAFGNASADALRVSSGMSAKPPRLPGAALRCLRDAVPPAGVRREDRIGPGKIDLLEAVRRDTRSRQLRGDGHVIAGVALDRYDEPDVRNAGHRRAARSRAEGKSAELTQTARRGQPVPRCGSANRPGLPAHDRRACREASQSGQISNTR